MIRTIKTISVLGFLICLLIMYMTDHGIPGIRKYDPSFRLLDMHFHYSSETVKETFDKISEGGRIAYKTYLLLDFIFIVFFLITMFTISDVVLISSQLKIIICTVCGLRALFDVLENILLLRMLGQYPLFNDNLAKICPWLTSFKFIMLYIWLIVILSQTVICGLKSIKR
ncbi:MAG: hypothetical protein GX327_04230 [Epulopiscium sp.]|nr:hypothetical protein [Candidatus Epulonipiscium sp.]